MRKVSYKNLMAEISKLQKQADMVRKTELSSVVADIQKKMKSLGLTVKDLQADTSKRKVKVNAVASTPTNMTATAEGERKRAYSPRRKPEAKFKDPVTGATWSGRGKTPVWMQDSLQKGKSKDHFAIR